MININLIKDESLSFLELGFYQLKEDLTEHHDYEAVTSEIWKHLSSWYAYDVLIQRYLHYDLRTEKTYLNLYPKNEF